MARTQAADYDDKRESIMHMAAKLFAQNGFAGASISELASRCEVSKSLLYHYYSSKEEMLFAIMSAHMELLFETLEPKQYEDIPKERWFYELSKKLLDRYAGGEHAQTVLLHDLDYLPPSQRTEIVQKQRQLIEFTENCLELAIAPQKASRVRLRAQVMLFFGMINWSHSWFDSKRGLTRDELALQAADAAVLPLQQVTAN